MKYHIIAFKEMVQRMFFWGWKMRHNYDFDASYIYDILYLKLDRVYTCFLENGHCVWNDGADTKGMKRLSIARNLAKRLSKDNYSTHMDEHYKVYPPNRSRPFLARWGREESLSFRRAVKKDSVQREGEKKYLFTLLEKHLDCWWD